MDLCLCLPGANGSFLDVTCLVSKGCGGAGQCLGLVLFVNTSLSKVLLNIPRRSRSVDSNARLDKARGRTGCDWVISPGKQQRCGLQMPASGGGGSSQESGRGARGWALCGFLLPVTYLCN